MRSSWSRFRARCAVAVVLVGGASASAAGPQTAAPPTESDRTAAVASAVRAGFGPGVEVVSSLEPFYLDGDLNGDGFADLFVVVRVAEGAQVPKGVVRADPYGYGSGAEARSGFAVIHGTREGWNVEAPAARYLLVGGSPVLALEQERWNTADAKDLMALLKKGTRRPAGDLPAPPRQARGASVYLPTEAAWGILYWNGRTYAWLESPED
jgi:hypothetical protein